MDETHAEEAAYAGRVLRAFIRDGRLVSIPAQERKRRVVLEFLMGECFAEDRAYAEPEVNERLKRFHEDTASLRRDLIRLGLMDRAGGEYRRAAEGRAAEGRAAEGRPGA
jgi:hypothetical protein